MANLTASVQRLKNGTLLPKTEGLQLLRQSTKFLSMKLKNKIIIIIFAGSICAAVEFFGIKFTRVFQPQADIWCVKLQYKLLMIGKN